MAVHFVKENGPKQRTVRHSRAYCDCALGRDCDEQAKGSNPGGRAKKATAQLARRKKQYEAAKLPGADGAFHRPGSLSGRKSAPRGRT